MIKGGSKRVRLFELLIRIEVTGGDISHAQFVDSLYRRYVTSIITSCGLTKYTYSKRNRSQRLNLPVVVELWYVLFKSLVQAFSREPWCVVNEASLQELLVFVVRRSARQAFHIKSSTIGLRLFLLFLFFLYLTVNADITFHITHVSFYQPSMMLLFSRRA